MTPMDHRVRCCTEILALLIREKHENTENILNSDNTFWFLFWCLSAKQRTKQVLIFLVEFSLFFAKFAEG